MLGSHEYKQTLSEPFNLANMAGYLDGVILDRSAEEIEEALEDVENLDLDADVKYPVLYDKLFTMDYPYIQKFRIASSTTFDKLMEIHPDPAPADAGLSAAPIHSSEEKSEPVNPSSGQPGSLFQP